MMMGHVCLAPIIIGDKVEWHPGIPGKPGEMGKDHWHWLPGGEKEKPHYSPGDRIKMFVSDHRRAIAITGSVLLIGGAVAATVATGGAAAPPALILAIP
jgi:hypothetical protein